MEGLYLSGNPLTPQAESELQARHGDALKLEGGVVELRQ